MTYMPRFHWGRSWSGTPLEDECPCPKEPCGLVSSPVEECEQHAHQAARTMRQGHRAELCPSKIAATHEHEHVGHDVREMADADYWCVSDCHKTGDCDGWCDPDCRWCPLPCPVGECQGREAA